MTIESHDNSIPSKLEKWAIDLIVASDTGNPKIFADDAVKAYDGTQEEAGSLVAQELTQGRTPTAQVFVTDAFTRKETDGRGDRRYRLNVLVGVHNERGGVEARVGEANKAGMHRCIEFIADLFEGAKTAQTDPDGNRTSDLVEEPNSEIIYEATGLYVGVVRFEVRTVQA